MVFIQEGKAKLSIKTAKIVSKDMPVFYNPVMELNRTISILLLNCIDKKNLQIALPLAGSGIRGIRFLKELKRNKVKNISFNDYDKKAFKSIKANLKLNKIKTDKKINIGNEDANLFLLNSCGFDYIDIDPFGSPNPFLDSAVKRISRKGILAVTATDTSALSGTYYNACLRKYWAVPLRNEIMHEIGLRILIRKAQLIGAQYNKALIPIFCYFKDHYMRVFLRCEKSKEEIDKILEQHGMFENAGPIWKGHLWEKKLVNKMYKSININKKIKSPPPIFTSLLKFLQIVKEESKIDTIGFYDLHKIVKKYKIKRIPKKLELIKKIKKLGFKAGETHFSGTGIRSDIGFRKLIRLTK